MDYADGNTITDTLAVVSVNEVDIERLKLDVPAIIYIEVRSPYVLQDISPESIDEISSIKVNPYLNLDGTGVLVGMIDSGIDYLNPEFIREDGTSRIEVIWDQTVQVENSNYYVGTEFSNNDINKAIQRSRNGENPYDIVPSKDENGHGTKMAGIIGARGYKSEIRGIANNSNYAVVKLIPSPNFEKQLRENGVPVVPVYNSGEVLSGIEFLNAYALKVRKPIVIFIGVGTTIGAHNANNIISRYLTNISDRRGIVIVAGTGNEGGSEGHYSDIIKYTGEENKIELNIAKEMKYFTMLVWVSRPSKMAINVISPSGEESKYISSQVNKEKMVRYILINTSLRVNYYDPDIYTGNQVIMLRFDNIKKGIWTIRLRGDYVLNCSFHIWLYPSKLLPQGTKFLKPNPYNTLTIPSTAVNVVTVAYYNSNNDTSVAESGRGYNVDGSINPDITTGGVNILTTTPGGNIQAVSGSSVATAIVAGVCSLMLQWGIVDKNDIQMFSTKVRSYLIYGANRKNNDTYPNRENGFGYLNIKNTFEFIGGVYRLESGSRQGKNRQQIIVVMDKGIYDTFEKRGDLFS
ncbi:S8 family peptidase [Clostridium paraputrificum]|uniref:S8 family peptidase n=1 Tax=Clostridium TaxID=1485 RepID=UPI0018A0633F|nr:MULTISPECIES: S8 family peptidase [Clostridium]MDB2100307.1 S8 family peptidase [Clostridium paraputrificum]MDU1033736.1 S8 family peptidase [Clostridium sp.]MDU5740295.1 S8 family peptidase [Clostridium sp.]MDU5784587.1 S8 family peptidase [Clostridium sp.]